MSTQNSHVTSLATTKTDNKSATTITARQQSNKDNHKERVPPTNASQSEVAPKSHKVEGKNKKSLHQKQRSNNQQQSAQKQHSTATTTLSSSRKAQKNLNGTNKPTNSSVSSSETTSSCSTLDQFTLRAQELKADICASLDRQASHHQMIDQPVEVVKLKNDILKLSGLQQQQQQSSNEDKPSDASEKISIDSKAVEVKDDNKLVIDEQVSDGSVNTQKPTQTQSSELKLIKVGIESTSAAAVQSQDTTISSDAEPLANKPPQNKNPRATGKAKQKEEKSNQSKPSDAIIESFEPLNARLDSNSKLVALISSLQNHFKDAPQLLEPVCRKLVEMSEQNEQLLLNCEKYQSDNQRLTLVKQKLENLCRELQKSNNAIRIESLELIKVEQGKAKEQTTKIQSTLSGVIKLFDENQQRNMSLRQENQELQTKLKSLLDHCDNWEKSVEASLRQRDIENRLIKTELAKANLLKNEEKEKFLSEKQELLQLLSMMQEQQHRIEGQEAKLRSDLSSYASKYDQCQAVISQGMDKFHTESQRMLKQIEVSRTEYKALLSKYESSNRKMVKLLEEKQSWARSMNLAKKKNDTLEKLCRALRERKSEEKNETASQIDKIVGDGNNVLECNQCLEANIDKDNSSSSVVEPEECNNSDKIAPQTSETGFNTDITTDDESNQNELLEPNSTHVV